jgi:hypothetical protein
MWQLYNVITLTHIVIFYGTDFDVNPVFTVVTWYCPVVAIDWSTTYSARILYRSRIGSNTSISSTQDNHNLLTILTMNCHSLRSEAKWNKLNTIIEMHQPHINQCLGCLHHYIQCLSVLQWSPCLLGGLSYMFCLCILSHIALGLVSLMWV